MQRWDIFCKVVDNYGDIGTCWRLARQLIGEHDADVRLWVDRLPSLARLCPKVSIIEATARPMEASDGKVGGRRAMRRRMKQSVTICHQLKMPVQ